MFNTIINTLKSLESMSCKTRQFINKLKDPQNFERDIKFFYQRLTRGWDDSETWSLSYIVAEFMLPRLERFRDIKAGCPSDMSKEQWDKILTEMTFFLTAIKNEGEGKADYSDEFQKRYEHARKCFGKYFDNLWW